VCLLLAIFLADDPVEDTRAAAKTNIDPFCFQFLAPFFFLELITCLVVQINDCHHGFSMASFIGTAGKRANACPKTGESVLVDCHPPQLGDLSPAWGKDKLTHNASRNGSDKKMFRHHLHCKWCRRSLYIPQASK